MSPIIYAMKILAQNVEGILVPNSGHGANISERHMHFVSNLTSRLA